MAEVQRGNVRLTVSEEEVSKYMAKGFSVVDGRTGKIIKQSVPTELGQLQKAYSEHVEIIKNLTAEVERLKAELAGKTAGVKATPAEPEEDEGWSDWQDQEEPEEVVEKPAKNKKKSK